jgi:transcriptional regulator with XRE-family HTH domain
VTTPNTITGANVRAEMARRKISQEAVAQTLGLSQASVSARLRGVTPFRVDELLRIADLLDVPLELLLVGAAA